MNKKTQTTVIGVCPLLGFYKVLNLAPITLLLCQVPILRVMTTLPTTSVTTYYILTKKEEKIMEMEPV